MQMRRRDGNTGFDRTLKRTRHLNVWLITTTRPSTSPRTSMMAVSAHQTPTHTPTHTDPNGNHGYNWHTNPSWNVVYRLCLQQICPWLSNALKKKVIQQYNIMRSSPVLCSLSVGCAACPWDVNEPRVLQLKSIHVCFVWMELQTSSTAIILLFFFFSVREFF